MPRFFSGFFVFLILSCNSSREGSHTLESSGSLVLNMETDLINLSNISYFREGTNSYIVYVNTLNRCINFRNIATDSIGRRVDLTKIDSIKSIEDGVAAYVHTTDSIFLLLNERNSIYLLNSNGDITAEWEVKAPLENNNREYVLQDIECMKLFYRNNKIYVQSIRDDMVLNSPVNRKIYYNSPPEVIVQIDKQPAVISNRTGHWPAIYKSGLNYSDYWPARCVNNKDEIIYSFAINDSLFVYRNNRLNRVIHAGTDFNRDISPFPDDSTAHFSFLKKYNTTEPRYKFIFFNKYKNEYYRVFYKGEEKETDDGRNNRPWSFICLDSSMTRLNETEFNSREYNYFSILPTPEGVLICKTNSDTDARNILRFGLFNTGKK
ncbi:MAG TPA: DUF4221 family protein [Bacteroidia bacterium]|jgi:hypothetical protein